MTEAGRIALDYANTVFKIGDELVSTLRVHTFVSDCGVQADGALKPAATPSRFGPRHWFQSVGAAASGSARISRLVIKKDQNSCLLATPLKLKPFFQPLRYACP